MNQGKGMWFGGIVGLVLGMDGITLTTHPIKCCISIIAITFAGVFLLREDNNGDN
jgi:hypothetical protein